MKADRQLISFSRTRESEIEIEVDTIFEDDEKILRIKIAYFRAEEKEAQIKSEHYEILAQLPEQEAIELRDFLNYAYPKEG
jgi:hypothetical protein